MPEPIEWRILQNLQTALRAISTASGHHYSVASAAVKFDPNQSVEELAESLNPPFLIIEYVPETWQYFPASQVKLLMPLTVYWVHDTTPTDDNSRMQVFLRGCADVEAAISIDHTRGGLAYDTRIVKRAPEHVGDGARVWAVVDLEIALHRTFGQPNG